MLSQAPEVVVEEKIEFEPQTIISHKISKKFSTKQSIKDHKGKISIVRNLSADTFNLEYEKMVFGNKTIFPYLNFSVNDGVQATHDISFITNSNPPASKPFKVHRSLFASKKFHDISAITVGYTMSKTPDIATSDYVTSRFLTNPGFHVINKNIYSNYNKVIHLKTIKAFDIVKNTKYVMNNKDTATDDDKNTTTTKKYNHIYLVPRELKRTSTNKTLFDIYMYNEDDRSILGDNRIISKKLKTTSFGKDSVDTQVVADVKNEFYQPIGNGHLAQKIARVDIVGRSFYDFDKGKTVLGNNSKSVDGEIIPYSLKDEYSRDLEISFNDTFKNMKIHLSKHFDQAVLDPYDGQVKLNVKLMKNKFNGKWNKLSDRSIKRIKEQEYSLHGLERLHE